MSKATNVHATGLVLGEIGVLLRGPTGTGKSVLALSLLDRWNDRGEPSFLISDDRVDLSAREQMIIMQAPPRLGGLVELRGRGIVRRPQQGQARLHVVIDLVEDFARMLEEHEFATEVLGIAVARAPVPKAGVIGLGHQMLLVREAIAALSPRSASL
ncbi:HPr kinase/phosphorylase [uncultured Devosia sp.]|uniref:HPr kinase/phosphorylase n=1 Tax=uncultured Devosia sp. TaxID=211434 RepID=UPI0035C9770F